MVVVGAVLAVILTDPSFLRGRDATGTRVTAQVLPDPTGHLAGMTLSNQHAVYVQPSSTSVALEGAATADVVVVGAGVVGLSAALQLRQAGLDVVVLEADRVGDGVTGASSAKVTALHQLVYADLEQRHGSAAAATYAEASLAATAWVREHAGEAWQARATMTVARDADELAQLAEEAAAAARAGLPVVLAGPTDQWPGSLGALVLEGAGQVDPVALLQALRDQAQEAGVRLHEGSRVTAVRERRASVTVRTAGGEARARHALVATGLPIADRGAFFALTEPKASYVVALEGTGSVHDAMLSAGEPTRSVRTATTPDGREVLLVGGEGHRTGLGAPTEDRYARLELWARETWPELGEVVARWSAEDFSSPDRLPFAGPAYRVGGPVHVVTGLSKWGLTLGVACATALAHRLATGGVTPFGELVDPARLPGWKGARTVAASTGQVAASMAGGWARALAPLPEPEEGEGVVGRSGRHLRAVCRLQGQRHETGAVCPHLGGILTWNDGDRTWDCPLHGSRFGVDGEVLHGPATRGPVG